MLYLENPLQIYANGEWLDELTPLESQLLKRLADGECVVYADLVALTEKCEDRETALALLLDEYL